MMTNTSGHEHNRQVAWLRLWGAVGAMAAADSFPPGYLHAVATDLASFEMRRYRTACYAFSTTQEIDNG